MILRANTSLAALGSLAHHLQYHTACNTSLPASKMAKGVWKYVKPKFFGSKSVRCLGSFISSSENTEDDDGKGQNCSTNAKIEKYFLLYVSNNLYS